MVKLSLLFFLCLVHIPTWQVTSAWRYTQRVVKRSLQQTHATNNQDQRDAILINKLLTKVVESVQTALKSNNSSQTPPKPFKLHFKARNKSKFGLIEPSKALKYLSLPLSNYSALDTKFIKSKNADEDQPSTSEGGEKSFTLSLPLFDMTSALSFPIDATLTADISVVPDAANGRIHMYSGPVYFIPENNAHVKVARISQSPYPVSVEQKSQVSMDVGTEMDSCDNVEERFAYEGNTSLKRFMKEKKEVKSQIPNWLIWGGNIDGEEEVTHVNEGITGNQTVVKSSIQANICIDMTWNQNGNNDLSFGTLFSNDNINREEETNKTLSVESNVQVNVALNLPVKGSAAFVLGLLPLRLMIAQIGSLVAGTIMRSLSPVFVDALIRDYMHRKDLLPADD